MFIPFFRNVSLRRTPFKNLDSTHLNELLTSGIAGIHLDWCKPCEFGAKMGAGRFPNTRRPSNEDGPENIRSILTRLFETRFEACRPVRSINTMFGRESSEITNQVTIVVACPPALYCRRSLSDFGVHIELSTVV